MIQYEYVDSMSGYVDYKYWQWLLTVRVDMYCRYVFIQYEYVDSMSGYVDYKYSDSSSRLLTVWVVFRITHCNSLQLTATHCNSLQHTATQWPASEDYSQYIRYMYVTCLRMQYEWVYVQIYWYTVNECNSSIVHQSTYLLMQYEWVYVQIYWYTMNECLYISINAVRMSVCTHRHTHS